MVQELYKMTSQKMNGEWTYGKSNTQDRIEFYVFEQDEHNIYFIKTFIIEILYLQIH